MPGVRGSKRTPEVFKQGGIHSGRTWKRSGGSGQGKTVLAHFGGLPFQPAQQAPPGPPPPTLSTGLTNYWQLEEPVGNRVDGVGIQHLLPFNLPGNGAGIQGQAVNLVAASAHALLVPNAQAGVLDGQTADWSVCAWFFPVTAPAVHIVCGMYAQPVDKGWQVVIDASGKTGLWISDDGMNDNVFNAGTFFTPAAWNFFGAAYEGSTGNVRIHLNGTTEPDASYISGVHGSVADFFVGNFDGGASYFDGRIDEVGFWTRALVDADFQALYNGGAGVTLPLP